MAVGFLVGEFGTLRLSKTLAWESQDQELVDLANWLAPSTFSESDGDPYRFLLSKLHDAIGGEVVFVPDPVDTSWIGVDLDGTLAFYDGYKGPDHIGEPIPEMLSRVQGWLNEGKDVRIFTARVAEKSEAKRAAKVIQDWTELHLGVRLPVTATKDHKMSELWDDRAVGVEKNTGVVKAVSKGDPEEIASEMADILIGLFGPDAEAMFDFVYGDTFQELKKQISRNVQWNEIEHPRGPNGRFINKYSVEAVEAAKSKIREILAGQRTPLGLKELAQNLSVLTVKQLKEVKKEFGISASGDKATLVQKIADRLHRGRSVEPKPSQDVHEKADEPTAEEILFGRSRAGEFKLRGLLRSRIAKGENASLLGHKVSSPEDLASVAQVYRDPRYETFRVILVKGDEVVGQNAYTSRTPDAVSVNMAAFKAGIEKDMNLSGADKFYLLHNHPSGDPTPSPADANMTGHFADVYGDKFKGHVIINHTKSVFLWKVGEGRLGSEQFDIENLDLNKKQEIPHELIGTKIDSVTALAYAVTKLGNDLTRPVVITTNVKGSVNIIVDVSKETLLSSQRGKTAGLMRRIGRMTGANGFKFLVIPDDPKKNPRELFNEYMGVISNGWVQDLITTKGDSYSDLFGNSPSGGDLSRKLKPEAPQTFREVKELKKSMPKRDGDGDGLVDDGLPTERAAEGFDISGLDIEAISTSHPRIAAAVLRKVADPYARLQLARHLSAGGVSDEALRQASIIATGKFDRPVGESPLDYLARATREAEDDGIHIPDSALQGKTDDEIAANFDNWIKGGNDVEKVKPKASKAKASEMISSYDGRPIDDFSRPFEIDDPFSLEKYSNDREGWIKYLKDNGEDIEGMEEWPDNTLKLSAENREGRFQNWLTEQLLASPIASAGERDHMVSTLRRYPDSGLERRIAALNSILEKTGGSGTAGRDWASVKFKPADSFDDLHEFWRKNGVYARFDLPDDVEPDTLKDFNGKPQRWSLDDANVASAELVSLLKQYPMVDIKATGLAYSVDKSLWDANLRHHLKKEYDKKSKDGKRFSKPAALKRVVESMVAEPPKVSVEGDHYRSDYDCFKLAWWQEGSGSLIFNHRSRLFVATPEKNASDRELYLMVNNERPSGVGSDIQAITRHEFAHAIDSKFRIEHDPEVVKAWEANPNAISGYGATKIKEFVAEGFADSFYDDGVTAKASRVVRDAIDRRTGAKA